ncbi:tRNA lysidine(34) synthetase TilS [Uliginosibacterium sp. H1]|uniref:tRNA lysidine(34) synthetase TilS n=1 Tax=Uliginosibacterium sp. H1 TaxID=3114757 RepID=UPI002E18A46B|nr:tRNA lysidine(34) synthetase TilS [Uliginosibacterium sp. H1]
MNLPDVVSGQLPKQGRRVCVAFSGGLDSTVLLHLLRAIAAEHAAQLQAVHVHHGLNPKADDWAAHCEAVCASLGVPLHVARVVVSRDDPRGVESAARDARHAVLAAQDADWIALAHHRDDQAETVLMRLLRGAGVEGMAAMRALDPARRLWRPLLDVSRAELLACAQAEGWRWIEDDSNSDTSYARNHLRHAVVPALTAHWPGAATTLARAAAHFGDAAQLLAELAEQDIATVLPGTAGARSRLAALPEARARHVLRALLALHGERMPDTRHLQESLRQLVGVRAIRQVHGATALCAYRDAFWLEADMPATAGEHAGVWQGETQWPWCGGELAFSPANGPDALRIDPQQAFSIGLRRADDRLREHQGGPSRAFRQLAQERGVPPWWRDRLPVLRAADGKAVWIGAIGADAGARCEPGEAGWALDWRRPAGAGW